MEFLKFIIPGSQSVSLKNSWAIRRGATPKEDSLYHPASIHQKMNNIRSALMRQRPGAFELYDGPVGVVLEIHIAYGTQFPRSDCDNFYTTCQECLMETIIEDDKQIEGFMVIRKRAKSKMSQFSYLYVWKTEDFEKEIIEFLGRGNNESRHTATSQRINPKFETEDFAIAGTDPLE